MFLFNYFFAFWRQIFSPTFCKSGPRIGFNFFAHIIYLEARPACRLSSTKPVHFFLFQTFTRTLSLFVPLSLSLDALIYCVCLLILFGADNDQSNSIVQRSLFLYLFVCSSLLLRKSNYCIFSFSFSAFSYLLFVRSVRSRLTET